jgi:hypothetical protein
MRSKEWERVNESVDGFELTLCGRAVERHDDAGDGSPSERDTNEVSWQKVEPVWDEVAKGARRATHARENGDFRGPGHHRS